MYKNCKCYYFDDIVRVGCINFSDIFSKEKSYENILIYDILNKIFMGAEPLRICFDKIDGFFKVYNGIRCLVLVGSERHNAIYDRINKVVLHIVLIINLKESKLIHIIL